MRIQGALSLIWRRTVPHSIFPSIRVWSRSPTIGLARLNLGSWRVRAIWLSILVNLSALSSDGAHSRLIISKCRVGLWICTFSLDTFPWLRRYISGHEIGFLLSDCWLAGVLRLTLLEVEVCCFLLGGSTFRSSCCYSSSLNSLLNELIRYAMLTSGTLNFWLILSCCQFCKFLRL
jgi:hypothetical protein